MGMIEKMQIAAEKLEQLREEMKDVGFDPESEEVNKMLNAKPKKAI